MRTLAEISADGSIANTFVADDVAAWPGTIDITDHNPRPARGWQPDGVGGFVAPIPPPATDPDVRIPRDDFIERFTQAEWLDGQQRAQTDANLAMALALLMGKPDGMVSLSSPRVADALGYMVVIGMLTPQRAAAIGALP